MSQLIEQMQAACAARQPISITGGNSKAFYGGHCKAELLSTLEHKGIIAYEPQELVITAKAGTPLIEITQALAEREQMFAFEPPNFNTSSTLGGMVACGFSGPARPWRGSLRDAVLGTRIINGKGENLHFGGEVIKNVAGYDAARLMAGAFGGLGLITEASVRTAPLPAAEQTRTLKIAQRPAIQKMQQLGRSTLPVSGLAWHDGTLFVRLSGNSASVTSAAKTIGGDLTEDNDFWVDLNQQRHPFFQTQQNLWRLSLPPACTDIDLPGEQLLDWATAQRWLSSDANPEHIKSATEAAGGHAVRYRSTDQQQAFTLPLPIMSLHKRLKDAFDPYHILNPERIYAGL